MVDRDKESKLRSLIGQLRSADNTDSEIISIVTQTISLVNSVDSDSKSKLMSLVTQTINVFNSMDLDSVSKPLSELMSLISEKICFVNKEKKESELMSLFGEIRSLYPELEIVSLVDKIFFHVVSTDVDEEFDQDQDPEPDQTPDQEQGLESKLTSLVSLLIYGDYDTDPGWECWEFISVITQITSLARSMDLDSQPKPESKLMSLVTRTISIFNSMDLNSLPKPLSKLISHITRCVNSLESRMTATEFIALVEETLCHEPETEFISLIYQILSLVHSLTFKWEKLVSLCPQVQVTLEKEKFHVDEEDLVNKNNKWDCFPVRWEKFKLNGGDDATHFLCRFCHGKNHNGYSKAPDKIKHPLHQKHSLQLAVSSDREKITRKCYCCDDDLIEVFYYCYVCDYAMNIVCVEKAPLLTLEHQKKWHEHTLNLFPRKASLTCDLCALDNTSCPFYICPPCDFLVHKSCIGLPHVIKISRHSHRISFTLSFDQGDWSCGICQRKIDNDYGGYSCIKDNCSYAAHSICATQSNVWDGVELEEVLEENEEEIAPFVRISDGVIQHFSHQEHHLRLDENTRRNYDENKECQACVMPIYCGNFYSCAECDFILHEKCANLPRKIDHPIHPHVLTLVANYNGEKSDPIVCIACPWWCTSSFFYQCCKGGCDFLVHVQCATVSEPLVHESHTRPLFLTSKLNERRTCSICKAPNPPAFYPRLHSTNETFNCIECDFALCFGCATLPHKLRYKHDKHMLALSYGNEKSTMASWCEICEEKIDPKERFYACDEYCRVTLHVTCMMGDDLYMKMGSSWYFMQHKVDVLHNNQQMFRPVCYVCKRRCPHKVAFRMSGYIFCSTNCIRRGYLMAMA
ncbi:unnamed protein product [Cochlearia groenlandica]